ncbi:MAG: hypothetical protein AAB473_02440 [Patescibacteria group bacterium]
MKVTYDKAVMHSPLAVLRKAGYSAFTDPQSGESSFVLRLTGEFYPRFHLYVDHKNDEVTFSLHLDQKKPSYGSNHMHSGEYEGPTIEKEMRRIDGWVKFVEPEQENERSERSGLPLSEMSDGQAKKPWWKIW